MRVRRWERKTSESSRISSHECIDTPTKRLFSFWSSVPLQFFFVFLRKSSIFEIKMLYPILLLSIREMYLLKRMKIRRQRVSITWRRNTGICLKRLLPSLVFSRYFAIFHCFQRNCKPIRVNCQMWTHPHKKRLLVERPSQPERQAEMRFLSSLFSSFSLLSLRVCWFYSYLKIIIFFVYLENFSCRRERRPRWRKSL